jgi:uncharacterized protein YerC
MNSTLEKQIKKTLALVLSDFKNGNEALEFLEDFFTEKEFETFAKRFSVGYWLSKKRSYENIKTNLGVSSATIAEIKTSTKKPGFKYALKKIEADEWATKWSKKIRDLKL